MELNKHHNWKGDDAGIQSMHDWVKRYKGCATKCELCGKEKTTSGSMHWSNKDHKYRRKLDDYRSLCPSCHKQYDIDMGLIGKVTEATKLKMSKAQTGKKMGEGARKKMSDVKKGIKFTEEHKRKMSEARKGKTPWNKGKKMEYRHWLLGKKHSEETKRKISETKRLQAQEA